MPTFNSYNVNFLHSSVIEVETLVSIVLPKGPTTLTLFGGITRTLIKNPLLQYKYVRAE